MQKNASLLAIVAVDTAENEQSEVWHPGRTQAREEEGARERAGRRAPPFAATGGDEAVRPAAPPRDARERRHELLTNFRQSVLGCIDSYDSENRRIFSGFSKSTRLAFFCSAPNSEFQQNFAKFFAKISKIWTKRFEFCKTCCIFYEK